LAIGDVRLVVSDPTAQSLEWLEKGPTERLPSDAVIDAPSQSDEDDDEAEEDTDETESADEEGESASDGELDDAGAAHGAEVSGDPRHAGALASRGTAADDFRGFGRPNPSGWNRLDAAVVFFAVGVLALSLWAIRWLARLGAT
jgi:hypothetical protein